MQKVG
jgi:hypothetical protein